MSNLNYGSTAFIISRVFAYLISHLASVIVLVYAELVAQLRRCMLVVCSLNKRMSTNCLLISRFSRRRHSEDWRRWCTTFLLVADYKLLNTSNYNLLFSLYVPVYLDLNLARKLAKILCKLNYNAILFLLKTNGGLKVAMWFIKRHIP